MAHLILVRHAKSEWNAKGIWTGLRDVGLSEHADAEVTALAAQLPSIEIHSAYTSMLRRAKDTLHMLKEKLGIEKVPTREHQALNERDYGMYTERNKWEVRDELGKEDFFKLRRIWDYPITGGETLKDVHARIVPFYESAILPELKEGKNVLVVAHGNSLRALIKHLENVSEEDVMHTKIGVAEARIYEIRKDGSILSVEVHTQKNGNV